MRLAGISTIFLRPLTVPLNWPGVGVVQGDCERVYTKKSHLILVHGTHGTWALYTKTFLKNPKWQCHFIEHGHIHHEKCVYVWYPNGTVWKNVKIVFVWHTTVYDVYAQVWKHIHQSVRMSHCCCTLTPSIHLFLLWWCGYTLPWDCTVLYNTAITWIAEQDLGLFH